VKLKRRSTVVAAGAAVALLIPATLAFAHGNDRHDDTSLRALASKTGLRIGTAVDAAKLGTDKAYTDIVNDQFSVVTAENVFKWDSIEPTQGQYNWGPADALVKNAQKNGQEVRGHTLMWHNQIPSWLTDGVNNGTISNAQLREILHKHVTDEVTHFKGKIWQWDVANETFANSWETPQADGLNANDFWIQHLGSGILSDVFRWAHKADPKALLFYNDYNITGEDGTNVKFQAVHDFVKGMVKQGVPIDGIGEQGHLDTQYGFNAQQYQADLQAYADLGLKVAITEADVRTFVNNDTEQVPTDSLAQFAQPYEFSEELKGCQLVRACISFTAWGVYDGASWIPGTFSGEGYGLLYDVNMQPKPAYYALQQDLQIAADSTKHGPVGHGGR
jgi:endo-1,4-beta-xylanase